MAVLNNSKKLKTFYHVDTLLLSSFIFRNQFAYLVHVASHYNSNEVHSIQRLVGNRNTGGCLATRHICGYICAQLFVYSMRAEKRLDRSAQKKYVLVEVDGEGRKDGGRGS